MLIHQHLLKGKEILFKSNPKYPCCRLFDKMSQNSDCGIDSELEPQPELDDSETVVDENLKIEVNQTQDQENAAISKRALKKLKKRQEWLDNKHE